MSAVEKKKIIARNRRTRRKSKPSKAASSSVKESRIPAEQWAAMSAEEKRIHTKLAKAQRRKQRAVAAKPKKEGKQPISERKVAIAWAGGWAYKLKYPAAAR